MAPVFSMVFCAVQAAIFHVNRKTQGHPSLGSVDRAFSLGRSLPSTGLNVKSRPLSTNKIKKQTALFCAACLLDRLRVILPEYFRPGEITAISLKIEYPFGWRQRPRPKWPVFPRCCLLLPESRSLQHAAIRRCSPHRRR